MAFTFKYRSKHATKLLQAHATALLRRFTYSVFSRGVLVFSCLLSIAS